MPRFVHVKGSEAFNQKVLTTLCLGGGAGNLAVGFWWQKCAFCYFWKKKKRTNWPNCEPVKVCKHSVKTCSNIADKFCSQSCSWSSFFPPDPRSGHHPSQAPRLRGRRQQLLLPVSLQRSHPRVHPMALGLPLGARGRVCPTSTGEGPALVQGLRLGCLMPCHRPRRDVGSSMLRIWLFPIPVVVPRPFQQCYSCSHYHPKSVAIFCTFSSSITLIITLNIPGATGTDWK